MIVGIDLGTTNSATAIWRDGAVEMIPNSLGHHLTPSAVSVKDDGTILVGLPARERCATHPKHTATVFKRYMGTQNKLTLGAMSFTPEELSAIVLGRLKADAEAYLGETVTEAVITVPAYFNDKQRKATRRAGQLAGLKVERLINEPTAAALAYGIADRERDSKFLVFDLGGGTFDVSILEIFEGVLEVRASAGDNRLGGEDFNDLLVARMRSHLEATFGDQLEITDALTQRLRVAAERAKRQFSETDEAEMSVLWQDRREDLHIHAEEFERLTEPLLARLRKPVLRALQDGRLRLDDIDEFVLVGGSTRLPIVRRAVTRMFGRFPSSSVDVDEVVARGAAIQAGLKARDAALNEVVLTDVCPYSLGIAVVEQLPNGMMRSDLFAPVIERNTTVPVSRMRVFSTVSDNQTQIDVKVYQGEERLVSGNIPLGHLSVQVPPKPAGHVSIECRFSYDINGLLEIDVLVPESGEHLDLVIVDDEIVTSDDFTERRAALAKLKFHPRDSQANLAVMARAGRCYESALGSLRESISRLVLQFEAVLEGQDPRAIDDARKELTRQLDAIEGQVFL